MTTIKLHNTKTRKKEVFNPIDPENVRIYLCGPTVYDRAHIGNARNVIMFDVLYRLLRHEYGPDHVTYVRNFTDVDDKINAEGLRRLQAGEAGTLEELIHQRTEETIAWYHADMDALGNLRPDFEPRATEYIAEMVAMTADLIAKGHAYEAEGHVLFDVRSFPAYGQLSGRSVDDMIAGARVEVAPYKRDPMDFVLWKPSDEETPGWDSPWGRGRPGWHIECSAMSQALLGPSFDIHGGGTDLTFPHHENELAQSCCANPGEGFANVWLHNEMLQVEGKKMSKSLGNFFTVRDLLDQGIPGEVIRFVFLQTHYRKTMDWTAEKVAQAEATLRDWAHLCLGFSPDRPSLDVVDALANDLNTSAALTELAEIYKHRDAGALIASAEILGFDLLGIAQKPWARLFEYETVDGQFLREGIDYQPSVGVIGWGGISDEVREASLKIVHKWLRYRREKSFAEADALKESAHNVGVELKATRSSNGINGGIATLLSPIDPTKLEALR
ncbi:cysteine--tRNA ligase [Pseudorhodobacter sp.]|uniref:cysteine--tRNA ligase n=1 Tax=Pseudorhodobacter sp. TaxID=1934400 RepID=UPI0026480EE0|nr:cysteine--tRNA ligase [Pseudorhodobacter sp.]MDN5786090.1 cysteine--tRNA ligase [Pseudorhodobacter sp.]